MIIQKCRHTAWMSECWDVGALDVRVLECGHTDCRSTGYHTDGGYNQYTCTSHTSLHTFIVHKVERSVRLIGFIKVSAANLPVHIHSFSGIFLLPFRLSACPGGNLGCSNDTSLSLFLSVSPFPSLSSSLPHPGGNLCCPNDTPLSFSTPLLSFFLSPRKEAGDV